ncbi:MAG: imidazole glycerol phosphate synthase subunit HisF [Endomicrobiales bacterium]|nr:imidazole glycerol phosphate synthase subunit HisF [Endomicrobiales bacterium]
MLKKRIIPKLQLKARRIGGKTRLVLVTSIKFSEYIEIGDAVSQAKIYQSQAADELIFVDIDASLDDKVNLLVDVIRSAAEEIFMPFCVGGGVKTIDDFRALLLNGADKVSINTSAVDNPDFINEASGMFGAQCVVLSIDFKKSRDGNYRVWTNCGTKETSLDPVEWSVEGEKRGAGEILLTSIDRDGTRSGLDIETVKRVVDSVSIPVIASGGCGLASHFAEGFTKGRADAVSAGTYFSFKDENLMQVRSQVKNAGVPIRLHL